MSARVLDVAFAVTSRLMLIGRILVAIAGAIVMGSSLIPDGAPGSPRAILLFAAGLYIAVGEVLIIYGNATPVPPVPP